jgi:5'-3' exonuclease
MQSSTIHIQLPTRQLKPKNKNNEYSKKLCEYEFSTDKFDPNISMTPPNTFMENLKKRMSNYYPSSDIYSYTD